jgi:hypothetical protein
MANRTRATDFAAEQKSELSRPHETTGDWPDFAGDDDAGPGGRLGPAVVLILSLIAMALVGVITLGWRVEP